MGAAEVSPSRYAIPGNVLDTDRLFAVAIWLDRRRRPATVKEICDTFEVSKATAYRYLAAFRRVNGDKTCATRTPSCPPITRT